MKRILNDQEIKRVSDYILIFNVYDDMLDDDIYFCYGSEKKVKLKPLNLDKVSEKEIISEQEAYDKILTGEFKGFTIDSIESVVIKDLQLEYRLDSKGYLVPIYNFDILLNESTNHIYVKAIK